MLVEEIVMRFVILLICRWYEEVWTGPSVRCRMMLGEGNWDG
jgi:hypothetical protein